MYSTREFSSHTSNSRWCMYLQQQQTQHPLLTKQKIASIPVRKRSGERTLFHSHASYQRLGTILLLSRLKEHHRRTQASGSFPQLSREKPKTQEVHDQSSWPMSGEECKRRSPQRPVDALLGPLWAEKTPQHCDVEVTRAEHVQGRGARGSDSRCRLQLLVHVILVHRGHRPAGLHQGLILEDEETYFRKSPLKYKTPLLQGNLSYWEDFCWMPPPRIIFLQA